MEKPSDLPPADPLGIDVAILDLNCGWPNLGHDSIVQAVRETAQGLAAALGDTGIYLRAISFAVRDHGLLPAPPGGRFEVYVGTGGPGQIDPRRNDGVSALSQGVREDPAWEREAFDLFDAVRADAGAALLAICHSFGVLCRWSGIAEPVLRGAAKGGKRTGLFEDCLSDEAFAHPWFSQFAAHLPDGRHFRVLENRLFDLIPTGREPAGYVPIGWEGGLGTGGASIGRGLTVAELARDEGGTMPRILGVNSHPEIVDRVHQQRLLEAKLARGEVSRAWYEERREALTRVYPAEDSDRRLRLTSEYTFVLPLRFHLHRQVRLRAEALGRQVEVDERRAAQRAP